MIHPHTPPEDPIRDKLERWKDPTTPRGKRQYILDRLAHARLFFGDPNSAMSDDQDFAEVNGQKYIRIARQFIYLRI